MAGRGPAPKPIEQRVNRHKPRDGEWQELDQLDRAVLPAAKRDWPDSVKRLWNGWRADPVTAMYSQADLAQVWELADKYEDLAHNEQRLRTEALGLTPYGRMKLRWRIAPKQEKSKLAVVRPLREIEDPRKSG